MAAYVHVSFLSNYTVLPRFKGVDDVLSLNISSNEPLFGTAFYSFRIINAYSNTVTTESTPSHQKFFSPTLGFPSLS